MSQCPYCGTWAVVGVDVKKCLTCGAMFPGDDEEDNLEAQCR